MSGLKDNSPSAQTDDTHTAAPEPVQTAPAATQDSTNPVPAETAQSPQTGKPQIEQPQIEQPQIEQPQESPSLSQQEMEHLTYLRVLEEYNIAEKRRFNYRRYGAWFIIITGIVFLTLIFSVEAKILFLCLWIITILACIAVMIKADYTYDKYKTFLGFTDELDKDLDEEEDEEE